jgi:hypothetical protein
VQATEEALRSGKLAAFAGPVRDQSGKVQIPAGKTPDSYQLESTTYLVQGVVGQIPSG